MKYSLKESYVNILEKIFLKYNLNVDGKIADLTQLINKKYEIESDGLVDSLKYVIRTSGTDSYTKEKETLLRPLLNVNFVNYIIKCFNL